MAFIFELMSIAETAANHLHPKQIVTTFCSRITWAKPVFVQANPRTGELLKLPRAKPDAYKHCLLFCLQPKDFVVIPLLIRCAPCTARPPQPASGGFSNTKAGAHCAKFKRRQVCARQRRCSAANCPVFLPAGGALRPSGIAAAPFQSVATRRFRHGMPPFFRFTSRFRAGLPIYNCFSLHSFRFFLPPGAHLPL